MQRILVDGAHRMVLLSLPRNLHVRNDRGGSSLSTFTHPEWLVGVVTDPRAGLSLHAGRLRRLEQLVDLGGGVSLQVDTPVRDLGSAFAAEPDASHTMVPMSA